VNGIEVTIDIADEDLSAAVRGQDVVGVDRDSLASKQRELYNNVDQARMSVLVIKLLEPMVNAVWKYLYYTKEPLDAGLDEEAFAGGYYDGGRVFELWGLVKLPAAGVETGQLSLGGFAVVSRYMFMRCLNVGNIAISQLTVTDAFADNNNNNLSKPAIAAIFDGVFHVNQDSKDAYERNLLRRYVCRESLLLCLAEAIVNKNAFIYSVGITEAEMSALKNYIEACRSGGGVPGSKRDAKFAAVEDAALRVFETAMPSTAEEDKVQTNLRIGPVFKDSQRMFIRAAMTISGIKKVFESQSDLSKRQIVTLREQEERVTQRIREQLAKTTADEVTELEDIIKRGFSSPADDALSTINTGYLFYTQLYWSALDKAYAELRMFVPCLARVYSRDALVESENYQTEYAALVSAVLRLVDARNPKVYRPDKSEMRAKTQFASEAEKLRTLARQDRAVKHWQGCGCGVVGNDYAVSSASAMNAMSLYPLAPSLLVSRGAF
jgi:hypothetical protein